MNTEVELSEDLQNLLNSLRTLEQLHNALRLGLFPGDIAPTLNNLLSYVNGVHGETYKAIQEHPQYELIANKTEIKANDQDGTE